MDKRKLRRKWLWLGGSGASLVGFGLSASMEVAFYKHEGGETWVWIVLGTLCLITFILGLVLLIKAGLVESKLQ